MLLLLFTGAGIPPVAGIAARRPTQRSAGARSNWRKIIVTNSIVLALLGGALLVTL